MKILITGGSSGIGAALAQEYAKAGHALYLTGRNEIRLEMVAKECRERGAAEVVTAICDVTNREEMKNILSAWDQEGAFDIVIANAGISGGTHGAPSKDLIVQSQKILDINVMGVIHTLEPIYDSMLARKCGQIILISSLASFSAWAGAPAYAASKAAVRVFGASLRPTLARDGISVSVVCPGFVKSAMTDANDFPMPFKMSAEKAAQIIVSGVSRRKALITFPLVLTLVVRGLGLLPDTLLSGVTAMLPGKKSL
ncbi:MAG: SDR family NAD(P)-dependent oxidoreductase [Pseudobdellovibrionaceae bacterium]